MDTLEKVSQALKGSTAAADQEPVTPLIGIDIGGTGIKAGLVDPAQGQLISGAVCLPTPQPSTPDAVAGAVALLVADLSERPEASGEQMPVGVTFPGIIHHGVVHSSANMHTSWLTTDINALLGSRLGRGVEVINDADAAGLAETRHGAGAGIAGTVLMITLGTGIGSALFFNGQLVPNAELGHLEVDGAKAETRASAVARERNGLSWEDYSVLLQRYLSHVEFLLSPELFIIGGGISQRSNEYLPNLKLRTPVVPATLRNEAGIVGAAQHAHTLPRTPRHS